MDAAAGRLPPWVSQPAGSPSRPSCGAYENGQTIITHAASRWARDLPAVRLHALRNTIDHMSDCVDAFDAAAALPEKPQWLMVSMTITVSCQLMLQAIEEMRAVLALSPSLRAVVARVEASKRAGGAA